MPDIYTIFSIHLECFYTDYFMGKILLLVVVNLLVVYCPATFAQSVSAAELSTVGDRPAGEAHSDLDCTISVPNAFTPNGDGINDNLKIECGCELDQFVFEVYHVSGRYVFSSRNSNVSWDGNFKGEPLPEGFYQWRLTYQRQGVVGRKTRQGQIAIVR